MPFDAVLSRYVLCRQHVVLTIAADKTLQCLDGEVLGVAPDAFIQEVF